MKLEDYIGETTLYDKKLMLERKDPISWLKSVRAFANTQGGKLLFGVAIRPLFHSSQTDFFAVLSNLNYGRTIDQMAGQVTGHATGQVTGQVEGHATGLDEHIPVNVARLLRVMKTEMGIHEIMAKIRLSSRAHLRKSALYPALELGLVEMTQPNSPRSPTQKYRLTERGKAVVKSVGKRNRP